jgi:hypothetical protein
MSASKMIYRIRPTWMLSLSNAALLDEFDRALDARKSRRDAPDLMYRLDLLAEEISRREDIGLLTEEDWKVAR